VRRRRAGVVIAALVLVAAVVAACNAVSAGSRPSSTSKGRTTSPPSSATTTTTTIPASFDVGIHTFAFDETGPDVTHVGPTGAGVAGRVLTTEVRYPTLTGSATGEGIDARPTTVGGPYPVIVFAHGWDTEPSDYQTMLDAWVKAGFVVVSPIFPDENATAVAAAGGQGSAAAMTEENDQFNEPGDIAYVLTQLESITTHGWGTTLKGVLDMSDVALAGQSDGANVVAALAYAPGLKSVRAQLPVVPKAVAVMSGAAWTDMLSGEAGTYSAAASSPALLQIQSDADGCNVPSSGVDLYASLQSSLTSKWWVTLFGANHLGPYEGAAPWSTVVDAVTTEFFELELGWRSSSLSASSVQTAGTVSGVAQVSTTISSVTVPTVPLISGC
jgi:hypothetical protein